MKHQEYRGRQRQRVVIDQPRTPEFPCPGCGKITYVSRKAVKNAAQRKHPGSRMRYYECGGAGSGQWHMTHQDARRTEFFRIAGTYGWDAAKENEGAHYDQDHPGAP